MTLIDCESQPPGNFRSTSGKRVERGWWMGKEHHKMRGRKKKSFPPFLFDFENTLRFYQSTDSGEERFPFFSFDILGSPEIKSAIALFDFTQFLPSISHSSYDFAFFTRLSDFLFSSDFQAWPAREFQQPSIDRYHDLETMCRPSHFQPSEIHFVFLV